MRAMVAPTRWGRPRNSSCTWSPWAMMAAIRWDKPRYLWCIWSQWGPGWLPSSKAELELCGAPRIQCRPCWLSPGEVDLKIRCVPGVSRGLGNSHQVSLSWLVHSTTHRSIFQPTRLCIHPSDRYLSAVAIWPEWPVITITACIEWSHILPAAGLHVERLMTFS